LRLVAKRTRSNNRPKLRRISTNKGSIPKGSTHKGNTRKVNIRRVSTRKGNTRSNSRLRVVINNLTRNNNPRRADISSLIRNNPRRPERNRRPQAPRPEASNFQASRVCPRPVGQPLRNKVRPGVWPRASTRTSPPQQRAR